MEKEDVGFFRALGVVAWKGLWGTATGAGFFMGAVMVASAVIFPVAVIWAVIATWH